MILKSSIYKNSVESHDIFVKSYPNWVWHMTFLFALQKIIARHRIHAPHFFFKHYKKRLLLENQKLTNRLLQTSSPYLFHPTYYNPSFLEHIGDHPYVITVHDMIHELFP